MNKIYLKTALIALLLTGSLLSQSQIINTIAGNGLGGFSGDGGQATSAKLFLPWDVILDANGNIYISDYFNNRIRKVNTLGVISTIAGNGYGSGGSGGFSGDGGQATSAELYENYGIALDTLGNLYISDGNNDRIRKVNTLGIINTFAGNGSYNYSGDGGPATSAEINGPDGIISDAMGNIYFSDASNECIRVVNSSGIINTFAGNGNPGFYGDGGPATDAELQTPAGLAIDTSGNIYIADEINLCIRKVNTSGIISTIAGNGNAVFSGDGGPATLAGLYAPGGVTIDLSGNIYIADDGNNRIRIVNTSGIINTFAGNGFGAPLTGGYSGDGGPATSAEFFTPNRVAIDALGNVFIADYNNSCIRKVNSASTGTNIISTDNNTISIYPTPTTGSFTISGITTGQVIEIYNYLGQKVETQNIASLQTSFDISNQPNGIYLVRILNKDGSEVAVKKIVKTN